MQIKIYLYNKNGKVPMRPNFILDVAQERAYPLFDQLYKDINIGNQKFVKCDVVIFERERFAFATCC